MHRYREYGLASAQDETLRRAFRDGFRRAGLSFAQFLDALAWYRDHARTAADEAQLADAFVRFAEDRGWPVEQRDGALDLYRAIRDDSADAVMQKPLPGDDRATLARADELLRTDPARYWGDAELQDLAFDARERLSRPAESAGAKPGPLASGPPASGPLSPGPPARRRNRGAAARPERRRPAPLLERRQPAHGLRGGAHPPARRRGRRGRRGRRKRDADGADQHGLIEGS
jgi:hypothetical protein